MIKEGGTVKLSDFGTSRFSNTGKTLTEVRGTERYLPPEILDIFEKNSSQKIEYSSKQDIWSLGIIAYELFTEGIHPYQILGPVSRSSIISEDLKIDYSIFPKELSSIVEIIKG